VVWQLRNLDRRLIVFLSQRQYPKLADGEFRSFLLNFLLVLLLMVIFELISLPEELLSNISKLTLLPRCTLNLPFLKSCF
jgi:hypothetical protein